MRVVRCRDLQALPEEERFVVNCASQVGAPCANLINSCIVIPCLSVSNKLLRACVSLTLCAECGMTCHRFAVFEASGLSALEYGLGRQMSKVSRSNS